MMKFKYVTVASLGLALAGCSLGGSNTSMYSVHQPVVERSTFALDVNVDGGGVAGGEQRRMAEWFEALDLGYGDRVSIDYGTGYANPAVRSSVAALAEEHGVLVSETAPVTPGLIDPGSVRVVVSRSRASVPSCPNWSTTSDVNYNSSNHSNYGCATNSNLAAMVADPEDLVRGRKNTSLDGNSGNAAINKQRAKQNGEGK